MVLEFYADSASYLFVPLDFLSWASALTEKKAFKVVEKFVHVLKQALYEAVTLRQGTNHIGEFSLGQAAKASGRGRQKTMVFFFAEKGGGKLPEELQEKLLAHARKAACDMFQ